MTELIICEKPDAAKKVAEALGKPTKKSVKGVPYYEVTVHDNKVLVGAAVGHLFGLIEKEKSKNFAYPVFDIKWAPTSAVRKESAFTKKYADVLQDLAKQADKFTVATDYDIEGELIGYNVIRFLCKQKDARRMKFSTLTAEDLEEAYEHAQKTIDWGQAEAGETRHFLDFYYGINLSRALTSALKTAGMFKILSTGRVQGPALKILVDKEKEILAFKPTPFWQLELSGTGKGTDFIALHVEDKFWEKKKAESAFEKTKNAKTGKVSNVEKGEFRQLPPNPFDLTTLQTEAYRVFSIKPKETLDIAQELYTAGIISYPRTSSQQLPEKLGFTKILNALAKQKQYTVFCNDLLRGELKPNNGKKTDPAHPAVYPTGVMPKALDPRPAKIYDLVVKRFLATFGKPAIREGVRIEVDVNAELFAASGTRTVQKNWHQFYEPYVRLEEAEMPAVQKGDSITVKKIDFFSKETSPPKRFTQSSVIRELEKRGLGTKATRAEIVDTLYRRDYVKGESIEVTELGIHISDILEKYVPKIVDEELTRHFEEQMDEIRAAKIKGTAVLEEAKQVLITILAEFKEKESVVGEGLKTTFTETRTAMTRVGKCVNCAEGHLVLRKGKFGRFIACDKYPECKTTFSLPRTGGVEVTEKVCQTCNHPMVLMIRKAKRPQEVCINIDCPSKNVPKDYQETTCNKCNEGKMILRKSIYGPFIACNKFPKCRNIAKVAKPDDKIFTKKKVAEKETTSADNPPKKAKTARKKKA